jgi:uncharacterized protein (TIGR00297 family)
MTFGLEEVIGLIVLVLLSLLSYKFGTTTVSGSFAGLVLGLSILLFGGWNWFFIFIAFFLVGSMATKFRLEEKVAKEVSEEKKGARNWKNAVSNGLPAALAAIAYTFNPIASVFFSSSISSALADTLATEIGVLSKRMPRLITNPAKKVRVGYSGGLTIEGYIAAFLGALIISLLSHLLGVLNCYKGFIAITLAGLAGCTIDSLIGATIQAKFRCTACGKEVELVHHCGKMCEHIGGIKGFGNNSTNFFSNLIAGAIGLVIFYSL